MRIAMLDCEQYMHLAGSLKGFAFVSSGSHVFTGIGKKGIWNVQPNSAFLPLSFDYCACLRAGHA